MCKRRKTDLALCAAAAVSGRSETSTISFREQVKCATAQRLQAASAVLKDIVSALTGPHGASELAKTFFTSCRALETARNTTASSLLGGAVVAFETNHGSIASAATAEEHRRAMLWWYCN